MLCTMQGGGLVLRQIIDTFRPPTQHVTVACPQCSKDIAVAGDVTDGKFRLVCRGCCTFDVHVRKHINPQ